MKKRLVIFWGLLFTIDSLVCHSTYAQSDIIYDAVATHLVLKVACIGNSITYGYRLKDPEKYSYPSVLQKLLGNNKAYVKNFGISGATMIQYGRPNLWQELDSIKQFDPGIVVIVIGTNETSQTRNNWEHAADFEKDYTDFILQLKSLTAHPVIFICSPIDMNPETPDLSAERLADLQLRLPRLWNLRKRIRKIAHASNVHFIDLTPEFKDKPSLFTKGDGVHPDKEGYHYLATIIYKRINKTVNTLLDKTSHEN